MCSYTIEKQRCRDRVINDFLSRSRHLLVPLLFHKVTSLHPPSFQRNDFSTCSTYFFIWGKAPIGCTLVVALVSSADKATIVWYVKANSTSTYIQGTIGQLQR